jgi:hypothetical protein
MKYTIIEDCSPYYIRFTHDGIDEVIEYLRSVYESTNFSQSSTQNVNFLHCRLSTEDGIRVLEKIPLSNDMNFLKQRVSFFVSKPGLYYRAHKDGSDHRFSLNYTIKIHDEKCVTSWYSDQDLADYNIDTLLHKTSRECIGFDRTKHTPLKSMIAKPNECILFNTEIFHDWDNTLSNNERIVLTLRHENTGSVYFDDAKKILFSNN